MNHLEASFPCLACAMLHQPARVCEKTKSFQLDTLLMPVIGDKDGHRFMKPSGPQHSQQSCNCKHNSYTQQTYTFYP